MRDIKAIIDKLELKPLPIEGGFYRQTYQNPGNRDGKNSFAEHASFSPVSTAIFYLITAEHFSAFHRLKHDEVYHFYLGDPVELVQINHIGELKKVILGQDILFNEHVQTVVPAHTWQGSRLCEGGTFALLGTTMSPGFTFKDFEPGHRNELIAQFPNFEREILKLTRV